MIDVGNMVWTCADGRRTPLREMGDNHLANCIAMVRRRRNGQNSTTLAALLAERHARLQDPVTRWHWMTEMHFAMDIAMYKAGVIKPRIRTKFEHPPIPYRNMDWSAVTDDYDYAPDEVHSHPIGHGATEAEAVFDLLEQLAS